MPAYIITNDGIMDWDEFVSKYGDKPKVKAFSQEEVGEVLEEIKDNIYNKNE